MTVGKFIFIWYLAMIIPEFESLTFVFYSKIYLFILLCVLCLNTIKINNYLASYGI